MSIKLSLTGYNIHLFQQLFSQSIQMFGDTRGLSYDVEL